MEQAIVVIPVYKEQLTAFEELALKHVVRVLKRYPIFFAAPHSLRFYYGMEYQHIKIERFADSYFKSIQGYNQLMLSEFFYKRFKNYKYMLIYQLDAFIFSDQLAAFCRMNYDYIGAPWIAAGNYMFAGREYRSKVGNGGFSLRRIAACRDVLKKYNEVVNRWNENEDCFFAYCGDYLSKEFRVAPESIARTFSFERFPGNLYKRNGQRLPFGCHAWMNFSRDFYFDIFAQMGIDISSCVPLMRSLDLECEKSHISSYANKAIMRQNYSLDFLRKYGQEWSVFGFGKYGAILIRWLLDSGFRIKCIFDNNKDKQGDAYCGINIISPADIQPGTEKILITNFKYEEEIIQELMAQGLIYGRDFVSFRKEYMRSICYLRNWA